MPYKRVIDCPECNGSGLQMSEVGHCDFDDPDFTFIPDAVEIPCENCGGATVVTLEDEDVIDLEEIRKYETF